MSHYLQIGWNRWNTWREKSINRRIFAGIIIISSFTLLAKVASLTKELVIASQFGTSDALDAFLIALLLPSFAINVVAGSINSSLIPTFIQVRENEGSKAAQKLLSGMMTVSILMILIFTLFFAIVGTHLIPLIGSGFNQEKLSLTLTLFYCLLPILLFSGLAAIWASILNAGEIFALVAITPIIAPALTVVVLLLWGKAIGVYVLAMGTVGGFFLEAGLLFLGLKRRGFILRPRWFGFDPHIRQVLGQLAPMAAGAFLMGSTTLVDQAMAAMLGPGSVSALNYGNRIVTFLSGIMSLSMSMAIFPHFSQMVAVADWISVKHILRFYRRLILYVSIPVMIVLFLLSESLIQIIFERGAFTKADTSVVGAIQAMYTLQIAFYLLGILYVRLISAMKGNRVLMWSTMISLPTNIGLNYLLMTIMGISGIALSTSIVYASSFVFLHYMSSRMIRHQENAN